MFDHNVVDVRGSLCPIPVIETKKVLEAHPGEMITTLVDNEVSRDNVKKFALSKGYAVQVEEQGDFFSISMAPDQAAFSTTVGQGGQFDVALMGMGGQTGGASQAKVILLTKDYLGEGSEELGRTLMKTFLFSVSEAEVPPSKILFINSAVKLVVEDSPHVEVLNQLAQKGVAIEACGICLDFYGLKEKVVVGSITNMYVIVEALTQQATVTL